MSRIVPSPSFPILTRYTQHLYYLKHTSTYWSQLPPSLRAWPGVLSLRDTTIHNGATTQSANCPPVLSQALPWLLGTSTAWYHPVQALQASPRRSRLNWSSTRLGAVIRVQPSGQFMTLCLFCCLPRFVCLNPSPHMVLL
jgi:hypothetical protein